MDTQRNTDAMTKRVKHSSPFRRELPVVGLVADLLSDSQYQSWPARFNEDHMKAGTKLDALVATEVMKWHIVIDHAYTTCNEFWHSIDNGVSRCRAQVNDLMDGRINRGGGWHPSTDIAHAWEVVEKLKLTVQPVEGKWWAGRKVPHCEAECTVEADTAPLAICLAALEIVRGNGFL